MPTVVPKRPDHNIQNKKHELFVSGVLQGMSGTQAAIYAGYSKKTAASCAVRLFKHPNIVARMAELKESIKDETKDLLTKWREEVVKRALFDSKQLFSGISDDKVTLKNYKELDGHLIDGVTQTLDREGNVIVTLKLPDKNKNLEMLGRHLGAFNDKLDVTSKGKSLFKALRDKKTKGSVNESEND